MTEGPSLKKFYITEIEKREAEIQDKLQNIKRLEAQRAELNSNVMRLKEELHNLHEVYSYVGEVVKVMGKKRVLVKVISKLLRLTQRASTL
jgi:26S proteasome regulatory subunit T6